MNKRNFFYIVIFSVFALFIIHRFTMESNFFTVSTEFERPQPVTTPKGLSGYSAEECGSCHEEIYNEWKTTIHSKAWREPYFQADFRYDGSKQVCLNCHTPLENQQENLVLGFTDKAKFHPILKPNKNFDPSLQNEGVTCAVCHIKDGVIVGPYDIESDAHPVKQDKRFLDGNGICKRCHLVKADRWDYFLKIPPCGNFAEVELSGEKIDCTKCHMPSINRPLVDGGVVRKGSRHIWRGGHDKTMVQKAVEIKLEEVESQGNKREFEIRLTNVGTKHYLPTGTPDRHLKISFRLLNEDGIVIKEKDNFIQRWIIWRPFVFDLYDNRIPHKKRASYSFKFKSKQGVYLEAEVLYGLLRESRRKKIGYENQEPITHRLFYKKIKLGE